MNPSCARCKKTVYLTEKLSCLDKIWHKGCFTCETCNLKLTMKNYKGYNKLPYCQVHYPTTKFTAVADTPENRRLAKNTQQQSDVVYHKDFESERMKYLIVDEEDPEIARLKRDTQQTSDIAYEIRLHFLRGKASSTRRLPVDHASCDIINDPPAAYRYPSPVSGHDVVNVASHNEPNRAWQRQLFQSGSQLTSAASQRSSSVVKGYSRDSGVTVAQQSNYEPTRARAPQQQSVQSVSRQLTSQPSAASQQSSIAFNRYSRDSGVTVTQQSNYEPTRARAPQQQSVQSVSRQLTSQPSAASQRSSIALKGQINATMAERDTHKTSFVRSLQQQPMNKPLLPPKPVKRPPPGPRCLAIYDYDGAKDDEVSYIHY